MHRLLTPALLVVLAGTAARAEDFSGFYAGINAGYATGRSRDRVVAGPGGVGIGDARPAGSDLPPSAAGAAATVRRTDRADGRGSRRR